VHAGVPVPVVALVVVVVAVELVVVAAGVVPVVVTVAGWLGVPAADGALVVPVPDEPPHAASTDAVRVATITHTSRVLMLWCFAIGAGTSSIVCSPTHVSICAVDRSPPPHLRRSFSPLVRKLDSWSPWWEPQLVAAAALGLDAALPQRLTIGASWLLPSVEGALLLGLVVASPRPNVRHSRLRRQTAIALVGLVSAINVYSLVELAYTLLHRNVTNGRQLIFSGIALWGTNVLLFGLWYFELDRGGPSARMLGNERHADFLFVQMSDGARYAPEGWTPRLIDYLYTSFTNATAFSPTDTMPLTANAKWLMSAQALVSLVTLGLIIARAVNIL
jgi:hypothetical protein